MTDFYTQFSMGFDVTPEEAAWLEETYADPEWPWRGKHNSEDDKGFMMEIYPRSPHDLAKLHYWAHGTVYDGPESLAIFLQNFLNRFRPEGILSFAYADTCSKPVEDGFGGGGVVITAQEIWWFHAGDQVSNKMKQLQAQVLESE